MYREKNGARENGVVYLFSFLQFKKRKIGRRPHFLWPHFSLCTFASVHSQKHLSMRILKENRAWILAFLLFYVTLTTVSLSEHTSSFTHTFAGAKSQSFNKRLHAPRYSLKRFAEDSAAVTGTDNRFSAPPTEGKNTLTPTEQFIDGPQASTASRAPPALL